MVRLLGVSGPWEALKSMSEDSKTLNYWVNLNLHSTDKVHVTACGFEADTIHDLMGEKPG